MPVEEISTPALRRTTSEAVRKRHHEHNIEVAKALRREEHEEQRSAEYEQQLSRLVALVEKRLVQRFSNEVVAKQNQTCNHNWIYSWYPH